MKLRPSSVVEDIFGQYRVGASASADKQNSDLLHQCIFSRTDHVRQLKGDDIEKRNRYKVEKIIVRNIWFHDHNFVHMIQNVKSSKNSSKLRNVEHIYIDDDSSFKRN